MTYRRHTHPSGTGRLQIAGAALRRLASEISQMVVLHGVRSHATTAYRLWLGILRLVLIFGSSKNA